MRALQPDAVDKAGDPRRSGWPLLPPLRTLPRADGGVDICMKHFNIDDHTSKGDIPMTETDQERKTRTNLSSAEMADAAAAAVQKTPHRVTLESIKAKIHDVQYVNPALIPHMTICVALTETGFAVIGTSAPADAGNFNKELGEKFAMEDVIRQLWKLEGYALRERLHFGSDQEQVK